MPKKLIASSSSSSASASSSTADSLTTPLNLQPEHSEVIRRRTKPINLKQQNHIQDTKQQHSNLETTNTNNSKRDLNTINNNNNNNNKRFSCDELEILKERFVDFIKLDKIQPLATVNTPNSSALLPLPLLQVAANEEAKREETKTATVLPLSTSNINIINNSTNNLNKHLLIDNSSKNKNNNNNNQEKQSSIQIHQKELNILNTNNMDSVYNTNLAESYQHLPLPDPPPQFLLPPDNTSDLAEIVTESEVTNNPIANVTINQITQLPVTNTIRSYLSSRLSVISSSESSSGAEYSLSSSSSSTSSSSNRPEPPQRTVSIRNSSSTNLSMMMDNLSINNESCLYSRPVRLNASNVGKEDCMSIKSSSIYSSYRGFPSQHNQLNPNNSNTIVRSSRSVFSIYEEEDENVANCPASSSLSTTSSSSSSSSSSTSPYSNLTMTHHAKLERLNEFDIKRIESMYRSIGSIVHVCSCTCDLYTTTSEQIANLLNECWNLEQNSIVPVWLFDTGLNPKRPKQLRLLLVDKSTAFPFHSLSSHLNENVISQPILMNHSNKLKNPNCNEKRLTFTLNNKQLICLIQFYDLFTCKEFFKFYSDLEANPRHFNLFNCPDEYLLNIINDPAGSMSNSIRFKSMSFRKQIKKNQSQSMLSLAKSESCTSPQIVKNRYSGLIDCNTNNKFYKLASGSLTTGNINQHLKQLHSEQVIRITGITKNCISNPCAFQHIATLKNDDKRIRYLIENNNNNNNNKKK